MELSSICNNAIEVIMLSIKKCITSLSQIVTLAVMISWTHTVDAACPNLSLTDFSNPAIVKLADTSAETIYFCKGNAAASLFTLNISANSLIGSANGTKAISMGSNNTATFPINIPSPVIISRATAFDFNANNPLQTVADQKIPVGNSPPWNEPNLFHFYIAKNPSTSCSSDRALYSRLSSQLRTDASRLFYVNNGAQTFTVVPSGSTPAGYSVSYELGKVMNAELRNPISGTTMDADLTFIWEQHQRSNNPVGGGVAGQRYCHFAVAVFLTLKNTTVIERAGEYQINVGVYTR